MSSIVSSLRTKVVGTPRVSRTLVAGGLLGLVPFAACDRIKAVVKSGEGAAQAGDPIWQGDSILLASKPTVVFRVLDHPKGRVIAPVVVTNEQGYRPLRMGPRGWRAFDLDYLYSGTKVWAVRNGLAASEVTMSRGMWEAAAQLDTLGCGNLVPVGVGPFPADAQLAIRGRRPTRTGTSDVPPGELQEALSRIPTLIAPSSGIATSALARYQRRVHVIASGIGARPTILVEYNDPEQVSDTLRPMAQRPRQFIVALDKGVYGYRPSFTYSTLGNALTPPRMRFLDYVDIDGDGKAEIFFGFLYAAGGSLTLDATTVLRYDNEAWREVLKEGVRCQ